ncbi:MAG: ArnT family glycosyltransferase [Candidatus Sumerlaeaceae bacterium]
MPSGDSQVTSFASGFRRLTRVEVFLYLGILVFAAVVRLTSLDEIPPGLWYDEAIYALDGWDVAHGKFPIFFETESHMREPMYIYSLGGFFALFGSSTLKARIVSALWGIATVALFFPVARRFAGVRWGLLGTLLFAAFRWHLHFSRTIFRAVLPPFFLLGVILFWLRWRERGRMLDAWLCGMLLGAGMYTYLSFRLVPIIMLALVVWEFGKRRMSWRKDGRGLAAVAAGAILTFMPLGVDYVRHPVHFTGRTGEISMFEKTVKTVNPSGVEVEQRVDKSATEAVRDLCSNAVDVARMWTIKGDHVGKHNLPYAPVFDWASGSVFYIGVIWCVWNWRRELSAFLTLAWLFVFSLTSIFSFGAPNLLRMQGATPAVMFAYLFGLRWLAGLVQFRISPAVRYGVAGAFVLLFMSMQLYVYFVKFPASPAVRREFLADVFYEPAEGVRVMARKTKAIWVPEELASTPTFKFVNANSPNVRPYGPADNLTSSVVAGDAVLVTARSLQLARETRHDQMAELTIHGDIKTVRSFFVPMESSGGLLPGKHKWAELLARPPMAPGSN